MASVQRIETEKTVALNKKKTCNLNVEQLSVDEGPIKRQYGDETDCDVAFYAFDEMDNEWRLPAHSDVLRRSNEVFSSMFSESFSQETSNVEDGTTIRKIPVQNVDARAFDNLLKYLYGVPVQIQAVETALTTLAASHMYQCRGLVNECVSCLTTQLNERNVLTVLKFAKVLAVDYQKSNNADFGTQAAASALKDADSSETGKGKKKKSVESRRFIKRHRSRSKVANDDTPNEKESPVPTAPPISLDEENTIEASCLELLQECLKLIDANASQILESEELQYWDLKTLELILSRDTLNIQDERKVFDALLRWAEQQCKRKGEPLTIENKREVLKDTIFIPRYLTMTLKSFQEGPLTSGIFAKDESDIIQDLLCGHITLTSVESTEAPLFKQSNKPRCPIVDSKQVSDSQVKAGVTRRHPKLPRFSIFYKFFRMPKGKCCKKSSNASTPVSSYPSSPTHEYPFQMEREIGQNAGRNRLSGAQQAPQLIVEPQVEEEPPSNQQHRQRRHSQTPRINIVEQLVVCFACLFD